MAKITREEAMQEIRKNAEMGEEELAKVRADIARLGHGSPEEAAMKFGERFLPIFNGIARAFNRFGRE